MKKRLFDHSVIVCLALLALLVCIPVGLADDEEDEGGGGGGGGANPEIIDAVAGSAGGVVTINGSTLGDYSTMFVEVNGDPGTAVAVDVNGDFSLDATGYVDYVDLVAYDIFGISEAYPVILP